MANLKSGTIVSRDEVNLATALDITLTDGNEYTLQVLDGACFIREGTDNGKGFFCNQYDRVHFTPEGEDFYIKPIPASVTVNIAEKVAE